MSGEGTVRQRADGTYEARIPGRGGKSFYGSTPEKAIKRRSRYLDDLRGGMPKNITRATVAEYLSLWLENTVRVNVRWATYEHHERIVRNHVVPALGKIKLKDLTAEHVQALHAAKYDAGYALGTRRHIHTTLSAALKQAVRFGHLPSSPAESIAVPRGTADATGGSPGVSPASRDPREPGSARDPGVPSRGTSRSGSPDGPDGEGLPGEPIQSLDAEGVASLIRTARVTGDRLLALYVLALSTGMRQGELLGLDWRHLDLGSPGGGSPGGGSPGEGLVHVRRSLTLAGRTPGFPGSGNGFGNGSGTFAFTPPKTERSRRTLELRPEAIDALREHRARQLEEKMRYRSVYRDQGLVFASTVGTPLRRQNVQRRSFKPLLKAANLPNIRFHDLRHTFATLMLRHGSAGADINTVSKMLGHSSVKVTLDVYAHIMPGMQTDALKSLDGLF